MPEGGKNHENMRGLLQTPIETPNLLFEDL